MMQKQSHAEKFDAISRMAAMIAHEIKNPVNNILLSTTVLQETVTDEESLAILEMIQRNGNRINCMLNELLQATGLADLQFSRVCITELMDEVLLAVNDDIILKKVRVEKKYTDHRFYINAEAGALKTSFRNIILNAVESMETGNAFLEINVMDEKMQDEKICRVDFRDNGNGIDASMQSLIFEPYFSTKAGRHGLGLTHAQTIILNHGGSLEINSDPGKGTCITVRLKDKPANTGNLQLKKPNSILNYLQTT